MCSKLPSGNFCLDVAWSLISLLTAPQEKSCSQLLLIHLCSQPEHYFDICGFLASRGSVFGGGEGEGAQGRLADRGVLLEM